MNNDAMVGIGGGPTRATTLPEEAEERKKYPVASGVMDYFPDAIAAISHLSWKGNEQHNPGQPLHWARGKSTDEADTMMRHFLQRGTVDKDGIPHTVKMAWRALALLQKEIEAKQLYEQTFGVDDRVTILREDLRHYAYKNRNPIANVAHFDGEETVRSHDYHYSGEGANPKMPTKL